VEHNLLAGDDVASPTISVFSLLISPRKRPSIRTVSWNDSLPSKSEP
jgi:hypothetical protein